MITPQQAARELQKRRAARTGPIAFAELVEVPGQPISEDPDDMDFSEDDNGKRSNFIATDIEIKPVEAKLAEHHKMVLREVEACFLKNTGRLMIFMPPGSAKSTYGSVVAPAYLMGKYKKTRVGLFSYADTLAAKMGRRTRGIIKQARYGSLFDTKLSGDSSAADNFTLTNGSEYMATGILGSATGNRFEFMVIDDPVKGRAEADSATIRDKTHEAYKSDLLTRLIPGGSLVIIQTRWHEDDLSGRILPVDWNGESGGILCQDGNVWRVLCLQAQCENDTDPLGRKRGEMLWPEWFTELHWAQFRPDARNWGSLCQQLPKPRDGNMFMPDMIRMVEAIPAGYIKWVRGWDLAATEGGGDYTAGPLLGLVRETGRLIIADVEREQFGPGKRDQLILDTATADGRKVTQDLPDDPGAAGTAVVEYLVKKLRGFPVVWSPESGDKETRAQPFASEVNVGNVDMLVADWNKALKNELRGFPAGTYDDQVDGLSRAYTRLVPLPSKMSISKKLLDRIRK